MIPSKMLTCVLSHLKLLVFKLQFGFACIVFTLIVIVLVLVLSVLMHKIVSFFFVFIAVQCYCCFSGMFVYWVG